MSTTRLDAEPARHPTGAPQSAEPDGPVPRVTVRYWAAARSAAGLETEQVSGRSVAEVVAAVRQRHGGEASFGRVLDVSSLLLRDQPLGTRCREDVEVADGDTVEVLPPFAGG